MFKIVLKLLHFRVLFCFYDYRCCIGGLLKEKYTFRKKHWFKTPEKISIIKPDGITDCQIITRSIFNKEKQRTFSALFDFNILRSAFSPDYKKSKGTIVQLQYAYPHPTSIIDYIYRDMFLSLEFESPYELILKPNSAEVMKFLISQTIVNCVKGFENNIYSLRDELRYFHNIKGKCDRIEFEKFPSLFSLFCYCKSFFNDYKINYMDSENLLESFMKFYEESSLKCGNYKNDNPCPENKYITAFEYARDFSALCESLRKFDKNLYDYFKNYDFRYQEMIHIHKIILIEFSHRVDLNNSCSSIDLLDKNNNEIKSDIEVEYAKNQIFIKFKDVMIHDIHFVKVTLDYKDIIIDISKFRNDLIDAISSQDKK